MYLLRKLGLTNNMFIKFTFAFILVGLVPLLLLSFISLDKFSSNIERITISSYQQGIEYTVQNLEKSLSDYDNITKFMYAYKPANYGMLGDILNGSADEKYNNDYGFTKKYKLLDDFVRSTLYMDKYIQNVFFIEAESKNVYYYSKDNKSLEYNYDFTKTQSYKRILENRNTLTFLPTHKEDYFAKLNTLVLTFARNYLDLSSTEPSNRILGTVLVDVNLDVMNKLFSHIIDGQGSEIFLVDSNGNCLYSNQSDNITKKLKWFEENNADLQVKNFSGYLRSKDSYWIFEKVGNSDWIVACKVSNKDILKQVDDIRKYIGFIVVLCIASLILVAVAFSKSFSAPVKSIIFQMKKVASGNLNVKVEVKSKDEVGQLAYGFNKMIYELRGYIDKAYVATIKQKEAELNALKSQIQPHYLYNTLEVIRMCSVENGDTKVADMIHSLSAQLKYVIGYNNDKVTLGQEIEILRHYFNIIKVRYDGKVDLEVNIPEKLLKTEILKLSIQPIVENAVMHGIKPKQGNGRVLITGEAKNDTLEISVFDDGVGISQAALEKILRLLSGDIIGEQTSAGWKSVGIKNVHDRLRINFGEKFGVDIKSHEKIGTVVKVLMPLIGESEANYYENKDIACG